MKLIGYDASGRDTQRYHHAIGCEDPRYAYRYPLREWGWSRADCEARIARARLPVPPKSSCWLLCLQMVSRLTATLYLWATQVSAV